MAKTYCFGLLAAAMMSYAACPQRAGQVTEAQPPLVSQASPSASESSSHYMYSTLENLCNAEDNVVRGGLVIKELVKMGMDYSVQLFEISGNNYRNIIAKIDADNEEHNLAFTAHYDRVDAGCGVVDNGSGVAVLLEMIREIKEKPNNNDLTFIFFDAEERGLWGSRHYVANTDDTFEAVFNIDMAGYGDSLMISGGVHNRRGEFIPTTEYLNNLIIELCNENSIPYILTEDKWTDNVSFNAAGLPAASVVRINSALPYPYPIHNEMDNMSIIDIDALASSKDFMLDILRRY
ncbi:MAG: M28 family metallopeptidase [Candidatus Nanoarchaeia archaeon]|nr:M28 family metallopeptidase [Candidatus Nanoarchaeia archaeon]